MAFAIALQRISASGTESFASGGSPNSNLAGSFGDKCTMTDTGVVWRKTSASGNTGWIAGLLTSDGSSGTTTSWTTTTLGTKTVTVKNGQVTSVA